ncbi:MAG: TolC family protein [Bacteroidales bacterium]|nr:TolC family protein [Bacteroidales bacterium]
MIRTLAICLFTAIGVQWAGNTASAQEVLKLSLSDAQAYALNHNYDIKNARIDVEISRRKVSETTAIGLPQVNASVAYNNFLNIPTQLIPDFLTPAIAGVNEGYYGLTPEVPLPVGAQFFETQFGVQHNMTAGISASQLIFSGPYIVGLQSAKAYVGLSQSNLVKSETDIRTQVAKAYFPILVLIENQKTIDSILVSLRTMFNESKEYLGQGFIEDTEVDQLELLVRDAETQLANTISRLELSFNYLKLILGLPASTVIEATENLDSLVGSIGPDYLSDNPFDIHNNIEYRIVKNQQELAFLNMKRYRSEYLPSLSAFYAFEETGMRDKFNFLDKDGDWYPNQVLGVQLDIPILSGGSRKHNIQQARLTLEKVQTMDKQVQESLTLAERTARTEFSNAWKVAINKKSNMELAKRIHGKTEIKYREGLASSLDMSQTHNQYMQSEMEYLLAALDLLNKKADLDKILSKVTD